MGRGAALAVAVAVGAAGVLATAVTVWAVRRSPVLVDAHEVAIIRGLFVASYIAVGLYTWRRRPVSRLGPLFIGAGFLYALVSLDAADERLPYTIGRVLLAVLVLYMAYQFVAFPGDRLRSGSDRRFMIAFSTASAITWALALALSQKLPAGAEFTDCANRCPHNALALVASSASVTRLTDFLVNGVTAVGVVWTAVLLVRKARSPSRLRRRAVVPVLIAFIVLAGSFLIYSLLNQANAVAHRDVLRTLTAASAVAIPFALLAGQVRGRAFAVASLGRIVTRAGEQPVTPALVEGLICDALGDRTVALALAAPDRAGYVDVHGADLELPTDRLERSVIPITREGQPVAAVIHDPAAVEDLAVVEGLAATSLMLLENNRLLDELQASRARMAAAAGRERRRLERDLHDGAQQQLTALQIRLSVLLERVDEPELASDLERIVGDAAAAVDQLRELAHGIYPPVLQLSGLAPALNKAAREAPIPVTVDDHGIGRCPPEIEAAIYFCSLEALQNATKHAAADARVTITLERGPQGIAFSIIDNGTGFDVGKQSDGIGLLNMHDRIDAIGGTLKIISSPGRGTTVRGTLPPSS